MVVVEDVDRVYVEAREGGAGRATEADVREGAAEGGGPRREKSGLHCCCKERELYINGAVCGKHRGSACGQFLHLSSFCLIFFH